MKKILILITILSTVLITSFSTYNVKAYDIPLGNNEFDVNIQEIYMTFDNFNDTVSFEPQELYFYDNGTERLFSTMLKGPNQIVPSLNEGYLFIINSRFRYDIIITDTNLGDWSLLNNLHPEINTFTQAHYMIWSSIGFNANMFRYLTFYDYNGIEIARYVVFNPADRGDVEVYIQYQSYDYGNDEYTRGREVGFRAGYKKGFEDLEKLTNTEYYELGKKDAQKTALGSFDKWFVPAVIVVIILGGFVTIIQKRKDGDT